MKKNYKTGTNCIQAGYEPKDGEPRVAPIVQSTTYVYSDPERMTRLFDLAEEGFFYNRIADPTSDVLEKKMAVLDGGKAAIAVSSGQAASAMTVLNVCGAGDNFISTSQIYGGTYNLFDKTLRRLGIECRFADVGATGAEIEKLIDKNTKLIFAETIANPALSVPDFEKFAKISKKHGVLFAVDNTLATPALCRPLDHGANLVVYSTTKYVQGHASTIGGLIVDGGNFNFAGNPRYADFNEPDESYHGVVYAALPVPYVTKARVQVQRDFGFTPAPMTSFLTNAGLETLALRMKKHSDNALAAAQFLKNHKNVAYVSYPALEGDQNKPLAGKYLPFGAGGVLTFSVKGGFEAAKVFIKKLSLIKNVTHVADIRSCVLHPASTTHRQLSESSLAECGIKADTIRLSVGCEDIEDIINDLENALCR